jgi:poly-gamma-glutamate synthesis protein (capsule biosynthesis protein)
VLVASCHWGLNKEVLAYMTEIAHAAIDAGADIVMGHGPHHSLPVEVYNTKPIFYGLGNLSFHTGHRGLAHGNWLGMLVRVNSGRGGLEEATFQFVRHNDRNETILCQLDQESEALADILTSSTSFGTSLAAKGDRVHVDLKS